MPFSVAEHLGPNLNGRRCHGDDRTARVQELSREEANVAPASDNAPSSEQATGPRRPQELDMQIGRRREVAGTKASNQRGSQRVI